MLADQTKVPELPDKTRADILTIQLRLAQTQAEYGNLQTRLNQLQSSYFQDSAALDRALKDACKAVGVDCEKDWTLDTATLKFVKKAVSTPPPTPEKKP